MNNPPDKKQKLTTPEQGRGLRWWAYLLALVLPLLTVWGRVILEGEVGEYPTLIIFTVPIVLCAYWGGLFPGILATLVSYLGASYFLLPPLHSFAIADPKERWQQASVILAGLCISIICELLHRSQRRAIQVIAELQNKERELEAALAERKQAEIVSAKLAAIVKSSDDAIISKDLNGIITSWNYGAEKVFGYSADEMVGTSIMRLIPADRQDEEMLILGKIKDGGSMEHFETRRQTKEGKCVDVSITASPIKDASGQVVGVSKIARDITERKRAESQLKLLEACISRLNDIVLITEAEPQEEPGPRILFVNDAFVRRTGYSVEEVIGRSPRFLQGPKTSRPELDRIHAAMREFKPIRSELINYTKAGKEFWLELEIMPVASSAGNYTHFVAVERDITGRKRSERRSATQNAISRVLADSNTLNEATPEIMNAIYESEGWSFGAIWEIDKKSSVLRCLEVWHHEEVPAEDLVSQTRKLALTINAGLPGRVWGSGKPVLIPEIAVDANYPRAGLALKSGLHSALAFPIILEGEVIGVMDFLGKEIREADAETLEMFLGIGQQIGSFFKRRKLETQFRQSQKMEGIGQLAGGVAHDFNNILAVIQMQAALLQSSGGLSGEQAEFAEEIGVTVQRAAALTRQLLLFSRREVFQPRDLDLSESITSTAKMLQRILGENIQMQLKLASQPMFINADAGMMDQVLMNLAVNARDAMPNGGQLVIETSGVEFDEFAASQSAQTRVGSFVRLSVSDSGCGIPPENLSKIFEPFFTTKDVGKGTGLGLATVFGIVQQHQGWINVYSEINHGTTFRVYLPRLAKNGGSKSLQTAPTTMRGGNETILLAEDDPALRISVRKALSQLGYRILEAPTGVKALEVWKESRAEIRLLLTDLVMPDGMTGKDLAQRILQEDPKLKVIYMSGYSAEVVGKDFPLKEGVNFLTKPFQAFKLAQTIRELLDAKG